MARWAMFGELTVFAILVAAAFGFAKGRFWIPALVAAPFVILAFSYEMRSRGRRLTPELAGAVGVCSVVAIIVLADGGSARLAVGAWMVLGARAVSSIPHVRQMIARLHGRPQRAALGVAADVVALMAVIIAVNLDHRLVVGCAAVVLVVLAQRVSGHGAVARPATIGMRQMSMGFGVVVATAIGVFVLTK